MFFLCGGGGEWSSERAQKYGQQVWRVASQKLLMENGAQHERNQMIQAVHPRLTCAPQDEEISTGYLLDDD